MTHKRQLMPMAIHRQCLRVCRERGCADFGVK